MSFYVKNLQSDGEEETHDENRIQSSWGNRLQNNDDFRRARNGDHLLVPFECDICIYKKLRGCTPEQDARENVVLRACIRQINIDAFWSRATSTVKANTDKTKLALELSESVGLEGPYVQEGFLPTFDHCGYQVAIQMLLALKRPGRYSEEYTQYDTIRKVRTAYSNFARSSVQANAGVLAFGDDRGRAQRLVQDPVSSYWFSRFFLGCKRRMGQDWRPNLAMSTELILEVLNRAKENLSHNNSCTNEEKQNWVTFGCYIATTYVLSLRGPEGLLLDLQGIRKFWDQPNPHHFIIALRGKVKGEQSERCHLLPCCIETSSGIKIKTWVEMLIKMKEENGQFEGPAISDTTGKIWTSNELDSRLVLLLEDIFEAKPNLFPSHIRANRDEIGTSYQVFRSLRRASDTRALEQNVSKTDIELINRWHNIEKSQGNRPQRPMHQHYAQVDLLLKPYLRYTRAM
jgi:hypothetical protein